jgi:hypothetical protein
MSDHRCPTAGCENQVAADQLVCLKHWRLVPRDLQRALCRAYAGGAGAFTDEHIDAMYACVDAVDRQLSPAANDEGADPRGWA